MISGKTWKCNCCGGTKWNEVSTTLQFDSEGNVVYRKFEHKFDTPKIACDKCGHSTYNGIQFIAKLISDPGDKDESSI
ncbi:MAG: hypothetical protein ACRC92_27020 [Peptostreptococcaceae bacterium]